MTNYRVLKEKGVYILVTLPSPFRIKNFSAFVLGQLLRNYIDYIVSFISLVSILHAAGHIWSSNLSPTFVERFMLMDNKTPCDRLVEVLVMFFSE